VDEGAETRGRSLEVLEEGVTTGEICIGMRRECLRQHQRVVRAEAVGWWPPRRPHPVPGQQFHAHA
jgi:hypothetical protein